MLINDVSTRQLLLSNDVSDLVFQRSWQPTVWESSFTHLPKPFRQIKHVAHGSFVELAERLVLGQRVHLGPRFLVHHLFLFDFTVVRADQVIMTIQINAWMEGFCKWNRLVVGCLGSCRKIIVTYQWEYGSEKLLVLINAQTFCWNNLTTSHLSYC